MSKVTRADMIYYVNLSQDTETLRVVQDNDVEHQWKWFYIAHSLALFDQKVGLRGITEENKAPSLKYFAIFDSPIMFTNLLFDIISSHHTLNIAIIIRNKYYKKQII